LATTLSSAASTAGRVEAAHAAAALHRQLNDAGLARAHGDDEAAHA